LNRRCKLVVNVRHEVGDDTLSQGYLNTDI
jgi:hypothetical protein